MMIKSKRMHKEFMNEVEVLKEITKPTPCRFIVEMVDYFQCSSRNVISLEYIECGSLRYHLDNINPTTPSYPSTPSPSYPTSTPPSHATTFPLPITSFYTACIIIALSFLHSRNVTHGDIGLRNMMLGADGYVKLIDFGRASINFDIPLKSRPDFFTDYKQLGLAIYEMMTGEFTFHASMDVLKKEKLNKASLELIEKLFNLEKMLSDKNEEEENDDEDDGDDDDDDEDLFIKLQFFKNLDFKKLKSKSLKAPEFKRLKDDGKINDGALWEDMLKMEEDLK